MFSFSLTLDHFFCSAFCPTALFSSRFNVMKLNVESSPHVKNMAAWDVPGLKQIV
jgi:hypothetical protein